MKDKIINNTRLYLMNSFDPYISSTTIPSGSTLQAIGSGNTDHLNR